MVGHHKACKIFCTGNLLPLKQAAKFNPEFPESFLDISQKVVRVNTCSWAEKEHQRVVKINHGV